MEQVFWWFWVFFYKKNRIGVSFIFKIQKIWNMGGYYQNQRIAQHSSILIHKRCTPKTFTRPPHILLLFYLTLAHHSPILIRKRCTPKTFTWPLHIHVLFYLMLAHCVHSQLRILFFQFCEVEFFLLTMDLYVKSCD